jgi:CheY-like chemotaxis protein
MTHLVMLSRLPDVNAIGTESVAETKLLISHHTPQLVLLDLDLPDGTGLDVMNYLAQRGLSIPLVVISAVLGSFRSKLRPSDHLQLLTKPVSKSDLLRVVNEVRLGSSSPSPFSLTDYIQLGCMGQHSAVIECLSKEACGVIVIEKGLVWSAQDEQGQGVDAFYRLLLAEGALLRVGAAREPKGPRSIHESWEGLIFEAMRLKDEAIRDRRRTPSAANPTISPSAATRLSAPPPAAPKASTVSAIPTEQLDDDADFDGCVERGVRAVLTRDFASAIAEFERAHALRPTERMVMHRLERLRQLHAQGTR